MENHGQIAAESRNMNGVATVREKSGKTDNFLRSGKIFDIVKVSEKSGNSVFRFTVHKFSFTLKYFFFRKKRKVCCKASKAIKFIDTLCLTHVVVVVSGFCCECFLPKRKLSMACKKR